MGIYELSNVNTIVLSAGKFNQSFMGTGLISEHGLIPIRGKVSIDWCINALKSKGCKNIKIVLRENQSRLSKILNFNYSEISQFFIKESDDVFLSLSKVLSECDETIPTQIILGDTVVNEAFPTESDVFLSSSSIKSSKQWCLVSKDENNHINKIYNKERDISVNGKEALIGYYKFSDTKLLKELIKTAIKTKDDFIKVFVCYNKIHPIVVKNTDNWFDFGHVSGIVKARLELFNAREFNLLKVDGTRGVITKSSKKKQKLLDEVNWYKNLPSDISCLTPRLFNVKETKDYVSYEMELYGYLNLAETFLYGSNNLEDWYNIIDALLKTHKIFESYTKQMDKDELVAIYDTKTKERLAEIKDKNPDIYKMMQSDYIIINNVHYKNYPLLAENLQNGIKKLTEYTKCTVVHGDYCFSNILFDPMHYIFKFIDPRGRFKNQTIYGDPRYDIAKLRHSVVGLYDFIVGGLYTLNETANNTYEFKISVPILSNKLDEFFDELVINYDYSKQEIKLIEALLFLTMIPLHSDDVSRQKAFYLTAIKKLNEVLIDDK